MKTSKTGWPGISARRPAPHDRIIAGNHAARDAERDEAEASPPALGMRMVMVMTMIVMRMEMNASVSQAPVQHPQAQGEYDQSRCRPEHGHHLFGHDVSRRERQGHPEYYHAGQMRHGHSHPQGYRVADGAARVPSRKRLLALSHFETEPIHTGLDHAAARTLARSFSTFARSSGEQ